LEDTGQTGVKELLSADRRPFKGAFIPQEPNRVGIGGMAMDLDTKVNWGRPGDAGTIGQRPNPWPLCGVGAFPVEAHGKEMGLKRLNEIALDDFGYRQGEGEHALFLGTLCFSLS
jgi:hypothetical protein